MLKGGIKPKFVKRTIRELQDHFIDIRNSMINEGLPENEAEIQAENKIGDLNDIAKEALSKKELKSFISLHPKLIFLFSPLLCYILAAITCILLIIGLVMLVPLGDIPDGEPVPSWFVAIFRVLSFFYIYLLPLLLAIGFTQMANDRYLTKKISILSIFIISLIGSMIIISIPKGYVGDGNVTVTLTLMGMRGISLQGVLFDFDYFLISFFRLAITFGLSYAFWRRISLQENRLSDPLKFDP